MKKETAAWVRDRITRDLITTAWTCPRCLRRCYSVTPSLPTYQTCTGCGREVRISLSVEVSNEGHE